MNDPIYFAGYVTTINSQLVNRGYTLRTLSQCMKDNKTLSAATVICPKCPSVIGPNKKSWLL